MPVKNKKGHRQGRPIDRTIVSYLAGGLSRMSGITTGLCSGCCPRSSDLEADLARPCFSPTVPSWCRWFSCYRNSLRCSSNKSRGRNLSPRQIRAHTVLVQPCLCLANSLWRILDAADGLVHGCPENNFDFSCFLAPLPASYSLGNTKSKSSNPPASPFSFYLFLLNGTRRLQSAIWYTGTRLVLAYANIWTALWQCSHSIHRPHLNRDFCWLCRKSGI